MAAEATLTAVLESYPSRSQRLHQARAAADG